MSSSRYKRLSTAVTCASVSRFLIEKVKNPETYFDIFSLKKPLCSTWIATFSLNEGFLITLMFTRTNLEARSAFRELS